MTKRDARMPNEYHQRHSRDITEVIYEKEMAMLLYLYAAGRMSALATILCLFMQNVYVY